MEVSSEDDTGSSHVPRGPKGKEKQQLPEASFADFDSVDLAGSSHFEMKPLKSRTPQQHLPKPTTAKPSDHVAVSLVAFEDEEDLARRSIGYSTDDAGLLMSGRYYDDDDEDEEEEEAARGGYRRRRGDHKEGDVGGIRVYEEEDEDEDHGDEILFGCGVKDHWKIKSTRGAAAAAAAGKEGGRWRMGITQRNFTYCSFLLLGAGFLFPFDRFGCFLCWWALIAEG